MKKLLLLDNYDSFTYNLFHYLEELSPDEVIVKRNDEISVEEALSFSSIVISPGPGLPSDAGILPDLLQKIGPQHKVLGVCLGMQALTEAGGGALYNMEKVLHGVSTPCFKVDGEDPLFFNLPSSFSVGRYHSWSIDPNRLPADYKVTSKDENGIVLSVSHRSNKWYGVQFHPESLLTEFGKDILSNWLSL